jgi:hypothetical protein
MVLLDSRRRGIRVRCKPRGPAPSVQNCSRPAPARTGSLAENAEWMASSFEKTMPAMVHDLNEGTALAEEEDQMLGCLGAAVMMFCTFVKRIGSSRQALSPVRIARISSLRGGRTSDGDERAAGGHGGFPLRRVLGGDGHQARSCRPGRRRDGASAFFHAYEDTANACPFGL